MSLEYADFAHFYVGSGLTEAEARDDFGVYACFMECLVRHYWYRDPLPNSLGISVNSDTLGLLDKLNSETSLSLKFIDAAREDAGRRNPP